MPVDLDQWEERAAILEFSAGMSRFEAETAAARMQGCERWEVAQQVKESGYANGSGLVGASWHQVEALAGKRDANDLSVMQRQPKEENRSMPERVAQVGWACVVLLALWAQGGAVV